MILEKVVKFCVYIFWIAVITFGIHLFVLKQQKLPLFDNRIILAYCINTFFAIATLLTFNFFKKKYRNQLGFFFLGISLIKFVFFFILFQPYYKSDGLITKIEFLTFFIPYVVTLIAETHFGIKFLNKLK